MPKINGQLPGNQRSGISETLTVDFYKELFNFMKSLVIAEKPSVARDIARVLHCTQKGNGTLEGKDYVVTWALGHLVTLADPEEYDKKYMKWEISTLPMMPDRMKLVVIRQTGKQYNAVKTQLYRKDINDIIIATDAGREGELVARWILDKAELSITNPQTVDFFSYRQSYQRRIRKSEKRT